MQMNILLHHHKKCTLHTNPTKQNKTRHKMKYSKIIQYKIFTQFCWKQPTTCSMFKCSLQTEFRFNVEFPLMYRIAGFVYKTCFSCLFLLLFAVSYFMIADWTTQQYTHICHITSRHEQDINKYNRIILRLFSILNEIFTLYCSALICVCVYECWHLYWCRCVCVYLFFLRAIKQNSILLEVSFGSFRFQGGKCQCICVKLEVGIIGKIVKHRTEIHKTYTLKSCIPISIFSCFISVIYCMKVTNTHMEIGWLFKKISKLWKEKCTDVQERPHCLKQKKDKRRNNINKKNLTLHYFYWYVGSSLIREMQIHINDDIRVRTLVNR